MSTVSMIENPAKIASFEDLMDKLDAGEVKETERKARVSALYSIVKQNGKEYLQILAPLEVAHSDVRTDSGYRDRNGKKVWVDSAMVCAIGAVPKGTMIQVTRANGDVVAFTLSESPKAVNLSFNPTSAKILKRAGQEVKGMPVPTK